MKKFINISLALAAALAIFGCKKDEMDVPLTDVGPDVTVNSYTQSAFMGGTVSFSVTLNDADFDLSTLKVSLLFDETSVADTTIRTKENGGTYTGTLDVPFMANIPDGTATLQLKATNVGLGVSTKDLDVSVYRPVFEYLTLTAEDGSTYQMDLTDENFVYAVTNNFPAEQNALISAEYQGVEFNFGWAGSGVELDATEYIPFSNGVAGEYTIYFNTLTFDCAPFASLTVNNVSATMVDKDNYEAVVSLTKGGSVVIDGYAPGFEGWTIDPDFFEETGTDGSYSFLAVDGLYKINIGVADKFFTVERMSSSSETGTFDTTGSVWMIGGTCFGKPEIFSASWSPDEAALCMAEVSSKVHQLTFVGGTSIATTDLNVKLFKQKGWGGEFSHNDITTDSDLIYIGDGETGDDGNIYLNSGVTLSMGGVYRFTLDLNSNVLHFEKIGQQEVEAETITFAGTEMSQTSSTEYQAVVSLTQNQTISVTGISDLADWTLDPDFFEGSASSFSFIPVSGYYKVTAQTDNKFFLVEKMDDSGSDYASYDSSSLTGAVWMIGGNCFGKPAIFSSSWDTSDGLCLAQKTAGEFYITFVAGEQLSTSSINVKLFHQKGWGGEFGGGSLTTDSELITLGESDGNISLASGVTLEVGASYTFTLDAANSVLHFAKTGESTIESEDISINGTTAKMLSTTQYSAALALSQSETITVGGISDLASYWMDPDYFYLDGGSLKFNAMSGNYTIIIDTESKYATVQRMKDSDSSATATLEDGHGLWMMGWGGAHPVMTSQFGWDTSNAFCLAEVEDLVYQFTATAVPESDGTTMGGRIRTDYLSIKYFCQQGWGNECGKVYGEDTTVQLTESASALIKMDGTNIALADGVSLEEGSTYVLKIDLSKAASEKIETIDFYKK